MGARTWQGWAAWTEYVVESSGTVAYPYRLDPSAAAKDEGKMYISMSSYSRAICYTLIAYI